FRIENVTPSGSMKFFLCRPNWLEAHTPPLEGHIQTLVRTTASLLGREPDPFISSRLIDTRAGLHVDTSPPGASIIVDGMLRPGVTPSHVTIDLEAERTRAVEVTIRLKGYRTAVFEADLIRGETTEIFSRLELLSDRQLLDAIAPNHTVPPAAEGTGTGWPRLLLWQVPALIASITLGAALYYGQLPGFPEGLPILQSSPRIISTIVIIGLAIALAAWWVRRAPWKLVRSSDMSSASTGEGRRGDVGEPVAQAVAQPEKEMETSGAPTDRASSGMRGPSLDATAAPALPLGSQEQWMPPPGSRRTPKRSSAAATPKPVALAADGMPVASPRLSAIARVVTPLRPPTPHIAGEAFRLPLDLLSPTAPTPTRNEGDAREIIGYLETTMAESSTEAMVVEVRFGPTITRYDVELAPGVKPGKIARLADSIALALAASNARVEAPIRGKSAIGIEVPSLQPAVVGLRECLETQEFLAAESALTVALGVDVTGQPRYADLAKLPHLLIGGVADAGEAEFLNSVIISLLYRARPDEVKLILIDPKHAELSHYDGIPHLIHPVVTDVRQVAGVLKWAISEMERRYDLFVKAGTRNIAGYNKRITEDEMPMPYIVLIVDELADIMKQLGREVEERICRLAQLARATGIHLIIATQRPSVGVITGLIRANIGSRIAFAVASPSDSRRILNMNGADHLVGRGDLLYMPIDAAKPTRMQGPYISEKEIDRVVAHLKQQSVPDYISTAAMVDAVAVSAPDIVGDELFEQAVRLVATTGQTNVSMLRRRLKIGNMRAARLLGVMEEKGIVGHPDGAKPREVLIDRTDLDAMFTDVPPTLDGD
ncbi:MAG TPA: DNA translocase FtsK, partial [Armatimonadota bacterium]